jgi:hypothetical protein
MTSIFLACPAFCCEIIRPHCAEAPPAIAGAEEQSVMSSREFTKLTHSGDAPASMMLNDTPMRFRLPDAAGLPGDRSGARNIAWSERP